MCKVIIERSEEKTGFMVSNHLFSRKGADFTIQQLNDELKQYDFELQEGDLQRVVNSLVDDGVVPQRVGYYKRVSML